MRKREPTNKYFPLVIVFCFLLLSACRLCETDTRETINESVIIWGQLKDKCSVWIITPATQNVRENSLPHEDCELVYGQTGDVERLLHVQSNPGKITIYNITSETLSEFGVIETNEVEIVSRPQLSPDGLIYFAGIQKDQQKLFIADIQDGNLNQLNREQNGIPIRPLLSPDGSYLAYEVELDSETEKECSPYCGGLYHIFDTVTEEEWALAVEPPKSLPQSVCGHGWLKWSPTSERFAIIEVCAGFETIRIFDVTNRQPLGKIIDDTSFGLSFYGWVDENRLLYNKVEYPSFFGITPDGETGYFDAPVESTFIYSLIEGESQPLANLPLVARGEIPFTLYSIDWARQGSYFAGIIAGSEGNGWDLVILEIDDSQHVITLKQYVETNPRGNSGHGFRRVADPAWSESGEWLAFSEQDSQENGSRENSIELQFVDSTGKLAFSFNLPEGLSEYEFEWRTP